MRIAFLIRALTPGGAERQLALLAKGLAARGHAVAVFVFYAGGALERDLAETPVEIIDLKKYGRWDVIGFTRRLAGALRAYRADVVHSYLPSANIITSMLPLAGVSIPAAWGLRATEMEPRSYDWVGRAIARVEVLLGRSAQALICNSQAGRTVAAKRGFPAARLHVIRNGVDVTRFARDEEARLRLRREWGVQDGDKLIGLVGRVHVMKGHSVFLEAAARARSRDPNAKFVIVGAGAPNLITELQRSARTLGLHESLIWAGGREDMSAVYSALDALCSASLFGEGTSNVIVEAMSCGCPCIATDVGDAADLVGRFGRIAPPADAGALSTAMLAVRTELTVQERQRMRRHITELCHVDSLISESEKVLSQLVRRCGVAS